MANSLTPKQRTLLREIAAGGEETVVRLYPRTITVFRQQGLITLGVDGFTLTDKGKEAINGK